ncbi:MFS transporter [Paenibacillus thiaminolyticus]|uniref:MFS transporter n=2 Tax=Paenibacillus thiaminolyticus TaxID=49283 RepID=A0A3A3GH25_PANTH|nr:MFS transporter [Paenibacillus thiaminolyticus]
MLYCIAFHYRSGKGGRTMTTRTVQDAMNMRQSQIRRMYLYMFMIFTPGAVFSSFFPLFYRDIGYTDAMYGMQNAIMPIIGVVGNYLFGYVSDKFARMKPLILGLILALIAVLYFVFHVTDPWTVMGLIFLFQFLWVPMMTLTDGMAMLASRRLGDSYAVIRGFGAAGFAVSALIIGWLLGRLPGHAAMGWIMMALLAATGGVLLMIRDPRRPGADDREGPAEHGTPTGTEAANMSQFWKYVFTRRFLLFIAVLITYNMTLIFNDQYFSFLIRELNGTSFHIGLGWMLPAATEVIIFLYLGRTGRQFRPLTMLAWSAVILGIRALVIYVTDWLPLVLFMQAVQGIGIALFFVYLAEYMMDLIPDQFRASGQAVMQVALSIGATMTGSIIGAYIYSQWGNKALFLVMGAVLAIAAGGFAAADRLERRRERTEAASV